MAWIYVVLAAVVEVFWVVGLRHANSLLEWAGTGIAIIFSFFFVIKACEQIPSGTVYAVFTGSGAAAIVLVDFFVFNAPLNVTSFLFIGLILFGVIGIKLTSETHENGQGGG
ncbi:QacE family quaternary ammonium compound efflux SMR transporter [Sporosarcina sp. BI001-red]|uniref:DMT family transporter n=1 Tax=Sporosarcina sp. BI001-red TaxID=2282866 RepID=UPI000E25033C|nr:SMR family transporter [Sporosarcina sp. BI001-red]REB05637.1 QacE family quaternary ammonium compound efflux SMR transporter [Sporosarcina sp. BI001-red]